MSRVAIIGPGRLGTLLAVACTRAGSRVVAVAGGSEEARAALAARVAGTRPRTEPAMAVAEADEVLLTVPDDAIAGVVDDLVRADALDDRHRVLHLAGSRGVTELRLAALAGARTAACHPAMTVPAGCTDPDVLVGVPWAVTAAPADRDWARAFVAGLGGDPYDVTDAARTTYHAALTLASNAVGAAVTTARRLLLAAHVDDPAVFLRPLAHASVDNTARDGAAALTGPVARGDVGTVRAHVERLDADLPELGRAYRYLALATLEPLKPGLSADVVADLEALLGDPPGEA